MRKGLFLCLLFFASCAPKIVPIKGTYSEGNFEKVSNSNSEQVWGNIVEFFAKNGLSIKLIDKSSGLIISDRTSLTWTYENSKAELEKPNAWIVIQKRIDQGNRQLIKPVGITGEWNIRIKPQEGGKTLININLVNPTYITPFEKFPTTFEKGSMQSTAVFENWIFDKVK